MDRVQFDFGWKYKDYELRACPKCLARLTPDDPNETIDLVLWKEDADGKAYCFSLGYFIKGSEGYDFRFVGNRPFQYIDHEDIGCVWSVLSAAQMMLDGLFEYLDDRR